MPEEKGTGKHPHKKTSEPYPHTKEEDTERGGQGAARAKEEGGRGRAEEHGGGHKEERGEHRGGETEDLKSREYRDEKGEVHHHTKTYMEQHKGKEKE